jgi:DNA processing protein
MSQALRAHLALALTPGLGPRKTKQLVTHFGSAEAVLAADREALAAVEGIGPKLIEAILTSDVSEAVERELERAAKFGVTLLSLTDPWYPESLRQIYDPPSVLYVRGELPAALHELRSVAVVGTRNASEHALALSKTLARELAALGVVIVSGLALGVDGAAHQGALAAAGGLTVAVLGSGVDVVYPRQHQALARRIVESGGAVVSEYRLGTTPRAENFPGRNRIISGLSRGVVVVEAGKKSGALITADFATEEGRTVFALPGRVGDPHAAGSLALLKQGAVLVTCAQDVLDEFGWQRAPARRQTLELEPAQQALVNAVLEHGSPLLDDLIAATGRDAAELLPLLTLLELRGLIRSMPGGRYIVVAP